MNNPFYSEQHALKRWMRGPLAPHIKLFAEMLQRCGYSHGVGQEYVRRMGHLSIWLQQRGLDVSDLDADTIRDHVGTWKRRTGTKISSAPHKLMLSYLRDTGVIKAPLPGKMAPVDNVVAGYIRYLREDRGLSEKTIVYCRLWSRRFLSEHFGKRSVRLSELTAKDLTRHILNHAHDYSVGYRQQLVGVLRSFCRFLLARGHVSCDISVGIPKVAAWRLANVPGYLQPKEVELLLGHCNMKTLKGMRDKAVLLLLVRLGLRAGEVRQLTLDDIDWEAGHITVHGKGAKKNRLPLPHEVGEAIVEYLRSVRPRCSTRRVFVRMRAPHTGFAVSSAIGRIVKRALQRAGLHPPHMGSHLLRHTCATQMLRRGASLSEIGRILRHEDPDSTALYAKVDLGQLREVADSWPGGAS